MSSYHTELMQEISELKAELAAMKAEKNDLIKGMNVFRLESISKGAALQILRDQNKKYAEMLLWLEWRGEDGTCPVCIYNYSMGHDIPRHHDNDCLLGRLCAEIREAK